MQNHIRIVSLVPSLTETLCDLGLQNQIVGCTKYCVSPKNIHKTAVSIGGTKDPNIKMILSLKPTHVILNEEENTFDIRNEIKESGEFKNIQIVDSFPKSAEDSISLVKHLGEIFHCEMIANEWAKKAEQNLSNCKNIENKAIDYVYFIWRNPWMVAGDKTYISEMLNLVGFRNLILTSNDLKLRYPIIEKNDPILKNTQVHFFSSEPYPFKKRHIDEFKQSANLEKGHFLLVDGQNLSWYGTRTLTALNYLISLKQQATQLLNLIKG